MNILIILASYNGVKYIEEQVDSILNQEGVNVTLLVFDDGSSDGTIDLLFSKFSLSTTKVKIIQNSIPTGSAANNFLQAIKTIDDEIIDANDYIALSDQDDIWSPNKLREAGKILKKEKSDLYMSNLILWNESSNSTSIIKKSFKQKKYDYLFEGGSAGCTYVMSRQLINVIKNTINKVEYKNWIFFSHDWFIYFVARISGLCVFIDDRAFMRYRIHQTNVHGQLNTFSFYALKERLKLIMNGWFYYQAKGYVNL
ncbi:glycosyltransferase, partial [Flavobacterium sp.]|uniref:glycosyltransferase n=1 Tax=Flavobacterium sp. TaxID=239 RepID=UPI0037C12F94